MRRSMLSRCLVDIVFAYYLCVDQCYQGVLSIWFLPIIYVLINVIKVSCQYGFCLLFMRRSMLSRCLVNMVFAYYLCVDQCYQVSCRYSFCLLFMCRSMLSRCLVDMGFAYYLCVDQCYQGVLLIFFCLLFMCRSMLSRCLVNMVFAYYLCVDQCYQGVLSIWFLPIIYVLINVIKVSCRYSFCLLFMCRSMLSRCLVDMVFAYYLCVDQCYQGVLSI